MIGGSGSGSALPSGETRTRHLSLFDSDTRCPNCGGCDWDNIGVAFINNWLCVTCGWSTGSVNGMPPRA